MSSGTADGEAAGPARLFAWPEVEREERLVSRLRAFW